MGHPPRQHAAGIIGAHAGVVGVGGAVLQLGRVARQVEQQRRKTGEMDVFEGPVTERSEEHTSELQSLMRISYAVFCLKKKKTQTNKIPNINNDTTAQNK